jgi:predicted amidohydrolase
MGRMKPLLAAVIQLSSQSDVDENLARAGEEIRAAARAGAKLVVLPENFAFMGEEADKRRLAEDLSHGPISLWLSRMAKEEGVFLIGGGMPEKSEDPERPFNTSALIAPSGDLVASYRKVHLFDVDLPDGSRLMESGATHAGGLALRVTDVLGVKVGMTICYDLRFPEEYRALTELGARIVTVPAAFTLLTGKDHWSPLLRARAIENQVFVLAAAQHGKHPRGRTTYGKSMIIDPWGDVLAQAGEGVGFALARLDFAYQDRVRAGLPCLTHRRIR